MKNETKNPRITLVDVAKRAGVSRATASLVVRRSPLISEETSRRVMDSMRDLGYVYNRAAASLRSHSSNTIGMVVTDITNPFFAELTLGVEEVLDGEGVSLLLANSAEDPAKQERILRKLAENRTDGILVCPAQETRQSHIASLIEQGIPVGLIARTVPGVSADYTGAENTLGATLATEHLIALGNRDVAFLGGPVSSSARKERYDGYSRVMRSHGMVVKPEHSIPSQVSRDGGYQALMTLFRLKEPPAAALCYNDIVAFGVMIGLREKGMRPGSDFAVVGFDDVAEAVDWKPALTTVSIPPVAIGRMAAKKLTSRIADRELRPNTTYIKPQLIVRESSAGPQTRSEDGRVEHEKNDNYRRASSGRIDC